MLAGMNFGGSELVGLIVAVSFAAGLNVYATVATLGLLANAGLLDLPTGLPLITSWRVIAASAAQTDIIASMRWSATRRTIERD
jgi:hypothetical protein